MRSRGAAASRSRSSSSPTPALISVEVRERGPGREAIADVAVLGVLAERYFTIVKRRVLGLERWPAVLVAVMISV